MAEFKNNPLITILLGLLVAAIAIMGTMQRAHLDSLQATMVHSFDQLWAKLDRVTQFMQQKEDSIRADQRQLREELICVGKEIERLKTKEEVNNKRK